jgi:hypothetical protein
MRRDGIRLENAADKTAPGTDPLAAVESSGHLGQVSR